MRDESLAVPYPLLYEPLLRRALREDLGRAGDLTTDAIVAPGSPARGKLVARAAGRVAGIDVSVAAFRLLDPDLAVKVSVPDGRDVRAGQTIATLEGAARALLAAERTALNLLGHLCGIATATRGLVAAVQGTRARIVCTRKTTPGLRLLEKYAVRCGGGQNHRFGLDDAVLIKDNHIALAGGVVPALERVRAAVGHWVKIEVEVDTLGQLEEALAQKVEAVLLDNMDLKTLRRAVALAKGRAILEASGGVTIENVAAVAATGVDIISVGWLTHSSPALDVAIEIVPDSKPGGMKG